MFEIPCSFASPFNSNIIPGVDELGRRKKAMLLRMSRHIIQSAHQRKFRLQEPKIMDGSMQTLEDCDGKVSDNMDVDIEIEDQERELDRE